MSEAARERVVISESASGSGAPSLQAIAGGGATGPVTGPAPAAPGAVDFDVARVRLDFPILGIVVRGKPLVYLDNAATSQKPQSVIDAESAYYETSNANV